MGKCPKCGNDISIWARDLISGLCLDCIQAPEREAEAARQEAYRQAFLQQVELEQAEKAKLEHRIRDRVHKLKQSMLRRLEAGQPVIVYHSIYLPVDSVLLDEPLNRQFSTGELFQMGLQGWEAILIVPRTVGVGLRNATFGSTAGVTWGGGSGGNVAGVHVLLQKRLETSDIQFEADDELSQLLRSHLRFS